jgi:hypothetical protein
MKSIPIITAAVATVTDAFRPAIVSTEEVVASISALEDVGAHAVRSNSRASAATSLEFQKGIHP